MVNMEEELISKKEILELTDISYGQLYRWKRKNLIPEEWFIKKSSYTGQETYFPKAKILDRIDKIKNMKDDLSLDDLATMFSPKLGEVVLSKEELLNKNIVSQVALEIFQNFHGETKIFTFEKILFLALLEKFLQSGEVTLEEGKNILETMEFHFTAFEGKNCDVVFVRKFGVGICFLISVPNDIRVDKTTKLVYRLNLNRAIEEIKTKIAEPV
jgi:DNA-binding transcriptional MerR regulator